MSAENAWRIAREAATEIVAADYVCDAIRARPMPPAFRAEVEAEAEEAVKILRALDEHGFTQATWGRARALLSRLEAKGKGHE